MARTTLTPRNPRHLRAAIDTAGLSATDVAHAAGVSRQFLSLLLHGRRRCTQTVAVAIANAINVSASTFFGASMSDYSDNNTFQEDPVSPLALDDPYMNFEDVAEMARMKPASLRYIRNAGKGPAFKRVGKRLKIRRSLAVEWVENYEQTEADVDA